jgi:nucleoside-diphosphate-sugar epimerase
MHRGRVVVTGVAGFIGSNLADCLLAEGYEVTGIDDLSQGVLEQVPAGVEFHQADIRSASIRPLLSGAGAVFHLAAKNCISDCQLDPVETTSVNVLGTANVLEAAAAAGVGRVICAETSALYEGVDRFPTPEDEVAPRSFYAASKLGAREVAQAYARHRGMRCTALRYFCVYGPRQDYRRTIPPVMSAFILRMLRGQRTAIYGSGGKRRDFVYVDDVNDFHLRCLADPRTVGGTYNIGSGRDHSVLEVHEIVRRQLGSDSEPEHRPDLPGEAERTCADITRARRIGWEPRVSIEEGVARSISFIRDEVLARENERAPAARA